ATFASMLPRRMQMTEVRNDGAVDELHHQIDVTRLRGREAGYRNPDVFRSHDLHAAPVRRPAKMICARPHGHGIRLRSHAGSVGNAEGPALARHNAAQDNPSPTGAPDRT